MRPPAQFHVARRAFSRSAPRQVRRPGPCEGALPCTGAYDCVRRSGNGPMSRGRTPKPSAPSFVADQDSTRARRRARKGATMAQSFTGKKRIRKSFGRIPEAVTMPNLIEVQRSSYEQFLQREVRPVVRTDEGHRGGLQVGVPDQGLQRTRHPRIRFVRVRRAEVRRRRMHSARHDLRRAAQGQAAADRFRNRRRDRRPVGEGHQGAGRLHGRHPAHDGQGHLRRQRHRARHRLPDAPLAGRVLRPRQGQDPRLGQAAVRRPHHSVPRFLARLRVRRQGHRLRPHRSAP